MNSIKSAVITPCRNNPEQGAVLLAVLAGILLMGVLSAGVTSLTSTNHMQAANSKMGENAYYLAESGLRYAGGQYKSIENEGSNLNINDVSADDEKADFLENRLDGRTLTLPDNKGTIDIDVYPYWFVFAKRNGVLSLKLPGQVPNDFVLPLSGRLKLGNDVASPTYLDYTNGTVDADGYFSCDQLTATMLSTWERQEAYPVMTVGTGQVNTTALQLPCTTPGMFPKRNGRILIGTEYYTYSRTEFDSDTNILTLNGLSEAITVSAGDDVILKKFIVLKSTGAVGTGEARNVKSLTNSIPIGDSQEEGKPIDIALDSKSDFNKYFDRANSEGYSVQSLQTAGGGSTIFTNMKSLASRTDTGETNTYSQGSFTFKEGQFSESWEDEHILDYDLQIKLSSLNSLMYAGAGLEFRKKKIKSVYGVNLYQGFGISLMKFYSPALRFTNGQTEFKDGDWIYYYGNSAQKVSGQWRCTGDVKHLVEAQVDGPPVLTSGAWDTGDAAGIVRLKNSTLDVYSAGEYDCYAQSGIRIVDSVGQRYADLVTALHGTTGYNDYIPNSIKPPGMGSWLTKDYYPPANYPQWYDTTNEGDLLVLVLWQQKVEGDVQYRRILAYKDMTHDIYIKGEQDNSDGRIVNDETCLLLRIREDHIDTVKINKINIFYGDSSRKVSYTTRTKNEYPYDILSRRMAYWGGFKLPDQPTPAGGWSALWPPKNLSYWTTNYDHFDYFSHIEKPDTQDIPNDAPIKDPEKFQWDYIASETGEIESWDGAGNAIFTLDDAGTLTISDFTTPDSGTYDECEIALGAFFNSAYSTLVGFSDFSIRILDPGYAYGAFISSIQG